MKTKSKKHTRIPWNKGREGLRVRALTLLEVRKIEAALHKSAAFRDVALFRLGFDSGLRGSDLVSVRVADVWRMGRVIDTPQIAGKTVYLSRKTKTWLQVYIADSDINDGWLFVGRRQDEHLTPRQFSRLMKEWVAAVGITEDLATESLRRSRAQCLVDKTGSLDAARQLLGMKRLTDVVQYLDIEPCTNMPKAVAQVEID